MQDTQIPAGGAGKAAMTCPAAWALKLGALRQGLQGSRVIFRQVYIQGRFR